MSHQPSGAVTLGLTSLRLLDVLREAGLAVWDRSGPAMTTRCPISDVAYELRWWTGPNLTGQAVIYDVGWRDKPGPMITAGPPYPVVWDPNEIEDDPDDEPIEWSDDVDASWDAHRVTAADYDDPDSMINRIDRALELHTAQEDL